MTTTSELDSAAIAVIGLVCRFPGADNLEDFWANLRTGRDSISRFTREELLAAGFDAQTLDSPGFVPSACVIRDVDLFDAAFFDISPREAQAMDPQFRVFLEGTWEALENAGYDSQQYDGRIGIYAGCNLSTYFLENVLPHPEVIRTIGAVRAHHLNFSSHLTTQAAYKLDLRGPTVNVQTACSTSLVAVHLACQSLLNQECDMALAGGVSIGVPPKRGYWYEPDGPSSPDGSCRPFDAQARGTIMGDGLGIAVLKRLSDAVRDGDTIHAVILGSAVNNDGSGRAGYLAPSVDGQAEVVAEAIALAGVTPADISYVEAHGTATELGDPIELTALKQIFARGTDRRGFCGIGSVKSNIGHANSAAGIAGLIKTILALQHHEIPPTIHYEKPNPHFDIENSPFRIVSRLTPWDGGSVRRAGVSSFGVGGTNAHVIVQEAPDVPVGSAPERSHQLLVLSAKTKSAVEAQAARWARHLQEHPELDLADVAYTSRVGRRSQLFRRAIVAASAEEAARALAAPGPIVKRSQRRSVVFMFPGGGSQRVGMARGLYDGEPAFRKQFDECADMFAARMGIDLRELLGEMDPERLQRPLLMLPSLFTVSYALAQLWRSWGIEPDACIGHSIGEYAAACVAGVFTLEDAVTVVSGRARLTNDLPATGSMVIVPVGARELEGQLGPGIELALSNSPKLSVVAGEREAIDAWLAREPQASWNCRPLQITAASSHCSMMEPILREFERCVAGVALHAPSVPYVSNVTGTWITPAEATDPAYYARHLRSAVRFAEGIATLCAEGPERAFLEIGPGEVLVTLVRGQIQGPVKHVAIASLPHRKAERPNSDDQSSVLTALGSLWANGVDVPWQALTKNERRRRLPLPTYPFDRRKYWLSGRSIFSEGGVEPERPETEAIELDRRDLEGEYAEPRSAIEKKVAAIWSDLLGIKSVGIRDSFLELGGHSILAARLVQRIRQDLGIALSLREFLEAPTIEAIAAKAGDEHKIGAAAALRTIEHDAEHADEPFPLTDIQQAYWIGRTGEFQLGNIATHGYGEVEVQGLDLERAQNILRTLVQRQAMLRAVFDYDGMQRILPDVPPYEIQTLDLTGQPSEQAQEEMLRIRNEMSHEVRPVDKYPLWEVRAAKLPDNRTRVFISFDALLADAMSARRLLFDFAQLYVSTDETPLPPIGITFRDYILEEKRLRDSGAFKAAEDYWRGRLDDIPPAPELPVKSLTVRQPRFYRRSGVLDKAGRDRLEAFASRRGVTISSLVACLYGDVLGAFSKQSKFTINVTLFHRLPIHPDVDKIFGDFTTLALLSVDAQSAATFEDRASALQKQLWLDLDHRDFSGIRVLRELRRRRGTDVMMPVVFTSTVGLNAGHAVQSGWTLPLEVTYAITQTPQVWLDCGLADQPDGSLSYSWDAIEDLFPAGVLDAMFELFEERLHRLAAEEDAWTAPALEPPASNLRLYEKVNATSGPIPEGLLHEDALRHAEAHPDRLAIVGKDVKMTYGELASRVAALSAVLRERGAQRGALAGVVLPKGGEQVVAAIAILRAGAAYVPIDPALPRERLQYMLGNAEVSLVVTNAEIAGKIDWPATVTLVEIEQATRSPEPARRTSGVDVRPDDLAYVIYTSGSTGMPKGVMITHRAALNTIRDVSERLDVGPEDRTLALSSLSFDLSVYDIFGTLAAGGTIVMPSPGQERDPAAWLDLVKTHGVTLWNSVPALMEMFVEHAQGSGSGPVESLREILYGGDWVPVSLPDRVRAIAPRVRQWNTGGATELSIWCTIYPIEQVDPSWPSIPYGKPLRNQTMHVLHDNLQPCPVWVPGELYVGGVGVAIGYWQDPDKTAKKFIVHPSTGERLYRTGDWGRYLPDGTVEFLGREDGQVKIGGHRIEVGEIETALIQHPRIRAAAVLAPQTLGSTGRYLHAYVVPIDAPPSVDELRAHLAAKVPAYAVPKAISFMRELPLSPNGKVDRKALATSGGDAKTPAGEPAVTGARMLEVIAGIVSGILGRAVGNDDNLFELGADSVTIVRVANALQRELRFRPRLEDVFRQPTIRNLAGLYEQRDVPAGGSAAAAVSPEQMLGLAPGMGEAPLADPGDREAFKERRFAELSSRHTGKPVRALPGEPMKDAVARHMNRRSWRKFSTEEISLDDFGSLLSLLRQIKLNGTRKYRYASAGGLYPIVVYVFAKPGRVAGVEPGLHHYDPLRHCLVRVSDSAPTIEDYSQGLNFLINRPTFESCAFGIFLVAELGAITPMYGQAALRFAALEAGAMAGLLELLAPQYGLGLCQIGSLGFEASRKAMCLKETDLLIHHILGGRVDPAAAEESDRVEWEEMEV